MPQIAKLNDGPGSIKLPRSREPIVKANELLFVHFERPDISQAERYLLNFGMTVLAKSERELFMRGTGSQPYIYRASLVQKPGSLVLDCRFRRRRTFKNCRRSAVAR